MEKIPNFKDSSKKEEEKKDNGINRRDFLKIAGGALAYLSLPKIVRAGVGGAKKNDNKQENPPALNENQIIEEEISAIDQVEITPEFQRNMEKVLLSVPSNEDFSLEEIRKIYHDLLVKMPSYSIIQVLAGKGQEENFKKIIDEIQEKEGEVTDLRQRLQIIPTNNLDRMDMWAQDFGEVAKINGKDTFILSADMEGDDFYKNDTDRIKKRKTAVSEWIQKKGMEIKQADFFFEGGNVTFDKTEKGLRVFVGYSDIFYSQHLKKNENQKTTPQMIAKQISKCFGGAEVVVMGDKELVGTCFHIDQSFVILDGKQAVINQCSSSCLDDNNVDVSQQLRYHKRQLEELGYKIIEIENTPQQLKNNYSSTNAIPFVDKNTGQKKIILPIFPNEIKEDAIDNQEIEPQSLQGKGLAAYNAYIKAGYEPVLVRDHTHIYRGNLHCISNVLAKKDESKNVKNV